MRCRPEDPTAMSKIGAAWRCSRRAFGHGWMMQQPNDAMTFVR
jgi:hypothetical protein